MFCRGDTPEMYSLAAHGIRVALLSSQSSTVRELMVYRENVEERKSMVCRRKHGI
jgi:hypothetical protein